MTRCNLSCCVSICALIVAAAAADAGEQTVKDRPVLTRSSPPASPVKEDCEARMRKLDASPAEGQERLTEKGEVINQCLNQYKQDKIIVRLVMECAKYEEQPVVKQQFVAECQLAALNYANTLRSLKAEYGK